jgi:L-alanine-DL-glutamate epimerase-like enolase superfamily enzyme
MLRLQHYSFSLAFRYPFTTHKGSKTVQPTLITSLGLGPYTGYGEAPAINYYNVTIEDMQQLLESKRSVIERYSLTDPKRFWHFLHHLIPGQHFLTAALDIAAWDLFAKLQNKPLYKMLGLTMSTRPFTDYTLGLDTPEIMQAKLQARPWPVYKVKLNSVQDISLLVMLRQYTASPFRIDMNEGWNFDDLKYALPELQKLNVVLIEQPLPRGEQEAMKELKTLSTIPLFADESCQTEQDVASCAEAFHGINIKLTKCGGITPALRMIEQARQLGLKIMVGSMNESSIGTAAMWHLWPLIDTLDADGPLLLNEDVAEGLHYDAGFIDATHSPGLGVKFLSQKINSVII